MFSNYCRSTCTVLLLLFAGVCFAQNDAYQRVSIASPTAASLGKFVDYPVSLHTGVPEVSIPIYTIVSGSIKLPISLNYHASGLRVNEPASWVGAGWALDAGGIITRTVRGAPDEHNTSTVASQNDGHFSEHGFSNYYFNGAVQDWQAFAEGRKDGEPDLFFFQVPGYSGKFYFGDDGQAVLMPQQDIKIVTVYFGTGSIDVIRITTPDGNQYRFGNNAVTDNTDITNPFTAGGYNEGTVVSSWYLNRIQSADSSHEVLFTYTPEHYSYYGISTRPIYSSDPVNTTDASLVKNYVNGHRLNQITFRNGSVTFTPGAVRTDLSDFPVKTFNDYVNTEAKALGSIEISNGSSLCQKFTLFTSYFVDNSTALPAALNAAAIVTDKKRLRLDSVQESSCSESITKPAWVFSYFSEMVPRRLTFAQDHWGFFNGATANTKMIPTITQNGSLIATGANREAAWPAMRGGALYRIKYPTGGSTEFEFEPHLVNVFTGVATYSQSLYLAIGYDGSNPLHITQNVTLGAGLYKIALDNTSLGSMAHVYVTNSVTRETVAYLSANNSDKQSTSIQLRLTAGTYEVYISKDCNNPTGSLTGVGANVAVLLYTGDTGSVDTLVGGLRIKRMIQHDHFGNPDNVTNYSYMAYGHSSGVLFSRPTYIQLVRNTQVALLGYWNPATGYTVSCSAPGCISCSNFPYQKSGNSLQPLSTSQGAHIGYSEVKVSKPSNGYSLYRYLTNYPLGFSVPSVAITDVDRTLCEYWVPNYPAAPEKFDFIRGNLSDELHFSESGKLLKEINYARQYGPPTDSTPAFLAAIVGSQYLGTFYWDFTVKQLKTVVTTTDYSQDSLNYVSEATITDYASPYHCQPTKISEVNSKGDSLITRLKYAFDFRTATCDATDDCPEDYRASCNSCQATYTTAQISCSGQGSLCYTNAYLAFQQCLYAARRTYAQCRITMNGPFGAKTNCINSARAYANPDLSPLYEMTWSNKNALIETSRFNGAKLLSATYNTYYKVPGSNFNVQPVKISRIDLSVPSATFTPSAVNGTGITKDARYTDQSVATYKNGNLATISATNGAPIGYLWDYNAAYTTAVINNAADTEVAYTSFEADSKGNWNYTGVPVADASAITGDLVYSFNGTNNITRTGLVAAKMYVLSYWTKNAVAYSIPGTVGAASQGSAIRGGWTYFEHLVTGVTSVSIGSTGLIDELRLYPQGAELTTYTISPLQGMTSICNPNNQVIYYEYDYLGRWIYTKNPDGFITRYYDYKYNSTTIQ